MSTAGYHLDDTIVAIASPPGPAARGIVRLSGPRVLAVVQAAFRSAAQSLTNVSLADTRHAAVYEGVVPLERLGRDLPGRLYLWPGTRSYTRQPAAEFHTFGSPPLLAAALAEFCRHGARPAEPGEFTLRSFLAGRIDLTQAEAVLGVIDAQGARELQTAIAQLAGGLARPLAELRERLLDLLARLEAGLDFVEEDIEFISAGEIAGELSAARKIVDQLAVQLTARRAASEVTRVALLGLPNAGKSSLFNALAGAGALVSDQPGTTRDYLSARMDLAGIACELIDTAGAEAADQNGTTAGSIAGISGQAQDHTRFQAEQAELALLCCDATQPFGPWHVAALTRFEPARQLVVLTKCDAATPSQRQALRVATERLLTSGQHTALCSANLLANAIVETSSADAQGLEALRDRLRALAQQQDAGRAVAATAARAAESVRLAGSSLERAEALGAARAGDELVAAELRGALDELGRVSGAVATDDLLDRIFSRFCIGK